MDTLLRVRQLAAARNLSIYRIAQMSGICYSTIRTAEKRCGQLSVDVLERICDALGITLAEFFADEEQFALLQSAQTGRSVKNAGSAERKSVCTRVGSV